MRLIGKRLMLFLLLAAIFVAASGVLGVYKKEKESRILRMEAEARLADLASRKTQLEEDIYKLKTDRGMEEALREQYQLAKSGEGLIVIVDPPTPEPAEKTSPVMEWLSRTFTWW